MGTSWANMARLLRRTGFGVTGQAVDAALPHGVKATVSRMLAADPERIRVPEPHSFRISRTFRWSVSPPTCSSAAITSPHSARD